MRNRIVVIAALCGVMLIALDALSKEDSRRVSTDAQNNSDNTATISTGLRLLSYDPYESVDWSNKQGYYAFHVHIRHHDKGVPDKLYEETGHRGAVIGDAWCRTDHDQVHGYWPWIHHATGYEHTGEMLNKYHSDGMVAIPGGEYDGGRLQHHVGINTQYKPDCNNETEETMQAGIIANPEVGNTSVVYLTHYTGSVQTVLLWKDANELLAGMDVFHLNRFNRYANVYHTVLDSGLTKWWQFASDDYSFNRSGFHQARDINRNYFILEEHSIENVVQAIVDGAFYITQSPDEDDSGTNRSSPPEIQSIVVDQSRNKITITSKDAKKIEWIHTGGKKLATGKTLNYREHFDKLNGGWVYAKITSRSGRTHTQPWSFIEIQETPR